MHYILLCRSMTLAQRMARALQGAGVFASVTKAPRSANPGGCAYAVKIGEHNLDRALEILRAQDIPVGKLFALDARGGIREVGQ